MHIWRALEEKIVYDIVTAGNFAEKHMFGVRCFTEVTDVV